jgi:hypothetical protein
MHELLIEIREWLVFAIDAGILWILIVEYYYDAKVFEAVLLKKVITKRHLKKAKEVAVNETETTKTVNNDVQLPTVPPPNGTN